jgi:uncharacterized membrane protein
MGVAVPRAASPATRLRAALADLPRAELIVALAALTAFALRLSQIDQSLFGDEVLAFHEISGHSLTGTVHAVAGGLESSPPLFFVLGWLSAKLGNPTVWMRLPSLILSTATIPLLYLLGRETVGRAAAVIAAAILAVSPFAVFYGVEGRPYATLAFLVVLSTLALVRAVQTGRWSWWATYAVAAAAAAYTHYTAVFVLGVQTAWALWMCRHRPQRLVVAIVGAAALYAPWLPKLHGTLLGAYALLEPLTPHNVLNDLARLVPGYPVAGLHRIPTIPGYVALALCVVGGFACAVRRILRRTADGRLPYVGLIAALALASPVGVLLYSIVRTDIWDARNMWASIPAIALIVGWALAAIPGPGRRGVVAVFLGVLLGGTIRSFGETYTRPSYRSAAQFLDRVARPRDPIVVYPSYLNLDYALPVMLRRAHVVVEGIPKRWPAPPAGGAVFVVFDAGLARVFKLSFPHLSGLTLVGQRRYGGVLPFTVLTYRAAGA